MSFQLHVQTNPNLAELQNFFERVFCVYANEDISNSQNEKNQNLDEWFSISTLPHFLSDGFLLESRDHQGTLVGSVFVAKQHALTWPDGRKMEIFILGVEPSHRKQGIGAKLMRAVIFQAKKFGAKKIIVNTHSSVHSVHRFYEHFGFEKIGTLNQYYDNGDAIFFQKNI